MKPKAKRYMVANGGGLALEVMTSGTKIWRYRYSLHGKQQPLVTIGEYPSISLQNARDGARKYGETVSSGVSPVADAKKDRGSVQSHDSVRGFADLWFEAEIADKSKSYSTVTRRALVKDVYPTIGNKPLADVNAGDVLAICDKIEERGAPQMALFTRNVIKRMYEYAIARQVATINPAQQLVARFIATPQSRTRVLSPDEIGIVMRAVYASDYASQPIVCRTISARKQAAFRFTCSVQLEEQWRFVHELQKDNEAAWVEK